MGTSPELAPHKTFPGDRPSSVLLFEGGCNAFAVGMLLALYEHRTVVQGWLWNVNSFDQWGVELGKVLAKEVTSVMREHSSNITITKNLESRVEQRALLAYLQTRGRGKTNSTL